MTTKTTQELKQYKNPSYDESLPIEKRLADFLGKYHLVLNGVVAHDPFMLTYEGKPNDRCDTEDKQELIKYVLSLIAKHEAELVEDTIKSLEALPFHPEVIVHEGGNTIAQVTYTHHIVDLENELRAKLTALTEKESK